MVTGRDQETDSYLPTWSTVVGKMDTATFRDIVQVKTWCLDVYHMIPSNRSLAWILLGLPATSCCIDPHHVPSMTTNTLPLLQVVPAIALAAAGQVAATTLGQCARLLDEHGSAATLLTRHAARNAAYYTGKAVPASYPHNQLPWIRMLPGFGPTCMYYLQSHTHNAELSQFLYLVANRPQLVLTSSPNRLRPCCCRWRWVCTGLCLCLTAVDLARVCGQALHTTSDPGLRSMHAHHHPLWEPAHTQASTRCSPARVAHCCCCCCELLASLSCQCTGDLSHHVANRAQLYAARAAYQAQRQAHRVTSLTDTLADVLEASVQTAAASAQRAAHRQADRAAAFADDQAAAANIAMQSLVGRLPGGVQHNTSSNSSGGFAADEFDPWANIPPRHSNSSSDRSAQAACNAASPAAAAPGGTDSGTSSSPAAPPVSMFPQDVAQVHGAGFSTPAAATQELQDQLLATEAALENTVAALDDAHAQLAVRQLTADIFRAVERRATNEQLQELSRALLQSRAELHAARLQLEAAADTVAALPQQMVLMVQNQMRRAMREGMVELMREALASPEPATPAAAAAVEGAPVMGYSYSTGGAADLAGLAAAAAAPSAVAHTPRSPASPAANINSPAASADAAAAMEDDQACTEADQAAALLQLEQELLAGVSVAPAAAGRGVGAAAVAAAGGSGSSSAGSVADDDGRSSDGEAFVMVEAGAEEV